MKEDDKEMENFERAKAIMGRIDPELLSAALREMIVEADDAEEAEVAKAKEAIKRICESIPEGKDKISIISKAITELDSDIQEKEVQSVKEKLEGIDNKTIMEAAKEYIDTQGLCKMAISCNGSLPCTTFNVSCACSLRAICHLCLHMAIVRPSQEFICNRCLHMAVYPPCPGSSITCQYNCLRHAISEYPMDWVIDPLIIEQLKEEIIQELIQGPELPRAMKKMLKKIQEEK